jgi:DNA-directed RNA polymerase subunit RPC12/RpoP
MQVWLKGYQCQRCTHQWKPRKKGTPLKCPSCDSPYWQQPRREAGTARQEQSNGEDQDALLDLVEIPEDYRKRQEPMIKGKGTPVWALVSDSITGGLTPEEVSKFWGGPAIRFGCLGTSARCQSRTQSTSRPVPVKDGF